MPQMRDIHSSLDWCLLGMLLTQLLINVFGFASPFWDSGFTTATHQRALEQAESPISPEAAAAIDAYSKMYLGLAALVFLALVWRAVRKSNNSFKPNPLRGSA